jgi:rSAM/selenodomain-associated transferase 1
MAQKTDLILFFVKYPELGRVKTRLAKALGIEKATGLYRSFVHDMLAKLKSGGRPFALCFSPEDKLKGFQDWLGDQISYMPQKGANVGERMRAAFEKAFDQGYDRAVLIGSDLPDLPYARLEQALNALRREPCVIGPAQDGGYYLIGFQQNAFSPNVFENMPWGTGSVLGQTLRVLEDRRKRFHLLPQWRDVDDLDDLFALIERSEETLPSDSETMKYLSSLHLEGLPQ